MSLLGKRRLSVSDDDEGTGDKHPRQFKESSDSDDDDDDLSDEDLVKEGEEIDPEDMNVQLNTLRRRLRKTEKERDLAKLRADSYWERFSQLQSTVEETNKRKLSALCDMLHIAMTKLV